MALDVKVLYFASARELTEKKEEVVRLDGDHGDEHTTKNLEKVLLQKYPKLQGIIDTVVFAVNMTYVDKGQEVKLSENDEVALIPPIGGG